MTNVVVAILLDKYLAAVDRNLGINLFWIHVSVTFLTFISYKKYKIVFFLSFWLLYFGPV